MSVSRFINLGAHSELEVIKKIDDETFVVREKETNFRFVVSTSLIATTKGCPHCKNYCFRDWACPCCEECRAEFAATDSQ